MSTRTRSLALGAILLLALGLRLYRLDYKSLWLDEAYTWHYAERSLYGCIHSEYSNPPGSFLVSWVEVRLLGDSEFWLRFPSALSGVLATWLLFRLARRLFDDSTALWAALFLAISSFNLRFTQEARTFGFLACAVLASLEATVLLLERPTWLRTLAYIATSAIGLHLHYVFGFVIVGHSVLVLWTWCTRERRDLGIARWLTLQAVTGLLFLPWFLTMVANLRKFPKTDYYTRPWGRIVAMVFSFVWGYPTVSWWPPTEFVNAAREEWGRIALFFVLFVPLIALGMRAAWRRAGVGPVLATVFLVPTGISLALATAGSVRFTTDRYLGFLCPFWMMLLAVGLLEVRHRWLRLGLQGALLAVALKSLVFYFAITEICWENWRNAADYLQHERKEGDLICFYEPYMDIVYNYYDRGQKQLVELEDLSPVEMERARISLRGRKRVWLVQGHVPKKQEDDWPKFLKEWSACSPTPETFPKNSGTEVWEFVPRR